MSIDFQGALNELAGTTAEHLDAQEAANRWAGTTDLDLLGALNVRAGTHGLGLNAVCNLIAGTQYLDAQGALNAAIAADLTDPFTSTFGSTF